MHNWEDISKYTAQWEALPFRAKMDIVKAVAKASLYDAIRAAAVRMWAQGQKDAAQLYTENAHLCKECNGGCCGPAAACHFSVLDAYIALLYYPDLELPAPHTIEWAEEHGVCVWLEPGKGCLLPRDVRPTVCACYVCSTWEDAWLKLFKEGQEYQYFYLITLAKKAADNLRAGALIIHRWLEDRLETVLERANLTDEEREMFRVALFYNAKVFEGERCQSYV